MVSLNMRVYEDVPIGVKFELRITTQKFSEPATLEGLVFPSVPSTYQIDMTIDYRLSDSKTSAQSLFLDVYGPEFSNIKMTQHNYIQNEYNLYWLEFTPSATI
jgi:hypothetical protein